MVGAEYEHWRTALLQRQQRPTLRAIQKSRRALAPFTTSYTTIDMVRRQFVIGAKPYQARTGPDMGGCH